MAVQPLSYFSPLPVGPDLSLHLPFVVAPMAGISSAPFRLLCSEFGAPLCTSEMITAHLLAEGHSATRRLLAFHPSERIRSAQLYGTCPATMAAAAAILINEFEVHHIDINMGCPVRKIIRKGGGAAITEDPHLVFKLVAACKQTALAFGSTAPVSVKLRLGVCPSHPTFLSAAKAAQDAGASWVTLHARYAQQQYQEGTLQRAAICQLASELSIPVIGNGDVTSSATALSLLRETGAAAVAIGRGCLGRPWLLRDVSDALQGRAEREAPNLSQVLSTALGHFHGVVDWTGSERAASLQMRKFVPLYLLGFTSSCLLQQRLMKVGCCGLLHAMGQAQSMNGRWHSPASTIALLNLIQCMPFISLD